MKNLIILLSFLFVTMAYHSTFAVTRGPICQGSIKSWTCTLTHPVSGKPYTYTSTKSEDDAYITAAKACEAENKTGTNCKQGPCTSCNPSGPAVKPYSSSPVTAPSSGNRPASTR